MTDRRFDFKLQPASPSFTTESLLPRGLCPNTSPNPAHIRSTMKDWLENPEKQEWRRNRIKMVTDRLLFPDPPGLVVDYGAYFGEMSEALKILWPDSEIWAVDCDIAYLDVIGERDLGVKTVLTEPGRLQGFADNEVDLIVMADTAEHLYQNEWMQVLSDAYKVLRVGGSIINHCPIADYIVGKPIGEVVNDYMVDINHVSIKSALYIYDSLVEVGFQSIESFPCQENLFWGFARGVKA